jgi:hypothetical protein
MMLKLRKAAFLAAVAISGLSLAAGSASAAGSTARAGNGICEKGEFCLYENKYFNSDNDGGVYDWKVGDNDPSYKNNEWPTTDDGIDNETSGYWNRTGRTVCLYQHTDYRGAKTEIKPGGKRGDLGGVDIKDNRASSHRFSICGVIVVP